MGGAAFDAELAEFLDLLMGRTGRGTPQVARAEGLVRADPVTDAFAGLGLDLAASAGERAGLFSRSVSLCPAVSLEVAGRAVRARLSPAELWRFYLPICQAVSVLARGAEVRTLVGIAGPGASGKSVFAGLLTALMPGGGAEQGPGVALCAMDGFHYPNAYLDTHSTVDGAGRLVSLRARKGAPETFDAAAFVRCLRDLKAGHDVIVPRYDRRLHDPVADGPRIGRQDRVVLVEGNYLLLDEGDWADVAGLLDLRLFLTLPGDALREAMIERHVRGGRTPADAARHFERVDGPNRDLILSTMPRADLVIRRDAAQRVTAIERPPSARDATGPIESSHAP